MTWGGVFIFQCHVLCLLILLMGFLRQECWSSLPFPSPMDHVLSDLSTLTRPSWVVLHVMARSFIKLHKAVIHMIILFRMKPTHSQTLPKNWNGRNTSKIILWNCHYSSASSSDGKASSYKVGDPGSIPGSGRSPGEGNGNPFQYSCLENPMDWGSW